MRDATVLGAISEHTGLMRRPLWLHHVRYNHEHYGFDNDIAKLRKDFFDMPYLGDVNGIVLAAGRAFKALGYMPQLNALFKAQQREGVRIVACDLSLPLLAEKGFKPDAVCSVDAHPVVANFYRRSRKILKGMKVLLPTSIHSDVVNECLSAGAKIYWWQPFWRESKRLYTPGVTAINTGGNVGTTSFVILSMGLKCRPVGLLCLEFAWSDETPLWPQDFYMKVKRVADDMTMPQVRSLYNSRDGKSYVADPGYLNYLQLFQKLWKRLPEELKKNTYNLTREGILSASGLRYLPLKDFLNRAKQ